MPTDNTITIITDETIAHLANRLTIQITRTPAANDTVITHVSAKGLPADLCRIEYRDADALEKAVDESYYDHTPYIEPARHYLPAFMQPYFSSQSELGKPVKEGKSYPNPFFDDLASIAYFHTYLMLRKGKEFTTAAKKPFKTHIDQNGLYQLCNEQQQYLEDGVYRYIVSPKGGFYILPHQEAHVFHNAIRASQPVQCAGGVWIQNRRIMQIDNASGHYQPTQEQLLRTCGGLYAAGLMDAETKVRCWKSMGLFTSPFVLLGSVGQLIQDQLIKIPKPWTATKEVYETMASRSQYKI